MRDYIVSFTLLALLILGYTAVMLSHVNSSENQPRERRSAASVGTQPLLAPSIKEARETEK